MKAKAAVFMGELAPFDVHEFEVTDTPSDYGSSSLIASGICGTDVHFHNGKLNIEPPTIIGHEFVGKLEDCDKAKTAAYGLKIGDNVIADIAVPCGECLLCKTVDNANCVNMSVTNAGDINMAPYLFGGYTEVNYTPLTNLIKIPDEIDPVMVTTFACPGPTAIHAFRLAEKAGVNICEKSIAVVQGLGPVGCFAVMYLHSIGVEKIYAITAGNNDKRESLAMELGANEVLNITKDGTDAVTSRLQSENRGISVDLCFEASGSISAVPQGMDILRNRGVYLIPGQYSNSGVVEIQPQTITFKALHMIGSSQYSMIDVKFYLEFLLQHKELHEKILRLSSRYTIDNINLAFEDARSGDNIKTMLVSEI